MRLLADEHVPPAFVSALRGEGHDIAIVALADRSNREFYWLLGEREIERHYTTEEFDEDAEYVRG